MDDKWNVTRSAKDDGCVEFSRSWTGRKVFVVRLKAPADEEAAAEASERLPLLGGRALELRTDNELLSAEGPEGVVRSWTAWCSGCPARERPGPVVRYGKNGKRNLCCQICMYIVETQMLFVIVY